jgi:hypothetical protein
MPVGDILLIARQGGGIALRFVRDPVFEGTVALDEGERLVAEG